MNSPNHDYSNCPLGKSFHTVTLEFNPKTRLRLKTASAELGRTEEEYLRYLIHKAKIQAGATPATPAFASRKPNVERPVLTSGGGMDSMIEAARQICRRATSLIAYVYPASAVWVLAQAS